MKQAFFIVRREDPDRTWEEQVFDPHITLFNWTDRDYITLAEAREVYFKLGNILEEIEWLRTYA